MPDIVLIAHGSPDPRHAQGIEVLAAKVRARVRAGRAVGACYLDHHAPSPDDVARELTRAAVAVPVLLTQAYHARVDIPRAVDQLGALGASVRLSIPLGPDPRLVHGCAEILAAAGHAPRRSTGVVVFAAGSSDRAAVSAVRDLVARHRPIGWGPWRVAALDGGSQVEDVARELATEVDEVLVVSYMVAEGVLRDRMRERCDALGVRLVPGVLADTNALADLVVTRASALHLAPMMSA